MRIPIKTALKIKGLWENGRDSIAHALEHFSERGRSNAEHAHHDKWIVLSIHHAAECICNMRLLRLEPNCPLFLRNGKPWFPTLSQTLLRLEGPPNAARLSASDRELFKLLAQLPDLRHQLMHRTAPKKYDVSVAAMCMIGLLYQVERLKDEEASDIFWQSPPVERDVVEAIRYTRLDEYGKFIQLVLEEKYGHHRDLPQCPECGVSAVVSSTCQACFQELDYLLCPEHDEPAYYVGWKRSPGDVDVECPHCGGMHNIQVT